MSIDGLSDGTTSVDVDIADATVGADGTLTISFNGAIQATVTVVGAAALDRVADPGLRLLEHLAGADAARAVLGAHDGANVVRLRRHVQ